MDAAIYHPKTTVHQFCTFSPKIGAFHPNALPFPVRINQQQSNSLKKEVPKLMVKCAKWDSASEAERKLVVGSEEGLDIEEELKRVNEKCRGIGGVVELMECLEREAIMGEDEGREAIDYSRRALIFDRSSRVFQALQKQSQTESTASAPCV